MAELRFKLINECYIYGTYVASDGKIQESLKLQCDKSRWPNKIDSTTKTKMNRYKYLVDTYVGKCEKADMPILKQDIIAIIQLERDKVVKAKKTKLVDVIIDFNELLQEDKLKTDGKPYSKAYKSQYKTIAKHLKRAGLADIHINKFSVADFNKYIDFLISDDKKKKTQNTVSTYTTRLLAFFRITFNKPYQWHGNKVFEEPGLRVTMEEVDTGVIVNDHEVEKLLALDLTDPFDIETRDVFIFGCNIGLRYSDLFMLNEAAGKGHRLELNTEKTDSTLYIPMNSVAQGIWDKYQGKIPKLIYVDFLDNIKLLGKLAGINEKCLFSRTENGKRVREYYPKHQLLGTHTMRRTFATNAVKGKVPTKLIMRITGHKTEAAFNRYVRINSLEAADIMEEYSFFR